MNPLRWIAVILVGLLVGACAAAAPTATPTSLPAEVTPETASTQPTEDISLVGTTGRPQFLDSFAHW